MMSVGRFITIEGGEGSGKSTLAAAIVEHLRSIGIKAISTREPGGTPLAEEIRNVALRPRDEAVPPITELLLMYAARADHLEKVIRPALAAGAWVICDRFDLSSRAFQGAGRRLPPAVFDELEARVIGETMPDVTLLIDVPVEIGLARARARGPADRFESEEVTFHERVRNEFLRAADRLRNRAALIDGTQSEEDVLRAAINILTPRINDHVRLAG